MKTFLIRLGAVIRSPYPSLFIGIALVIISILEATDTVLEEFIGYEIRTLHGLMVLGLFQIIKSLDDLFSGVEYLGKGRGNPHTPTSKQE